MTDEIRGQMTWKVNGGAGRILYLRMQRYEEWRPYKDFPQYCIPEPPGNSPGYATFVSLLRKGWQVINETN